ncbi:PIN domain-containing protein [Dermacoccaceae bacterium W4C1]
MFTVILDTCVLFPPTLADTLLRIAETGSYGVRWSPDILDELSRNMLKAGVSQVQVSHRLDQMTAAFPFALVENYVDLEPGLSNDPKDRHVLAAAIRSECHTIVTANLKDFPPASLDPWGIEAVHPNDFLLNQLDLAHDHVLAAVHAQAAAYRNPPMTTHEILGRLSRCGVADFADECRDHLSRSNKNKDSDD